MIVGRGRKLRVPKEVGKVPSGPQGRFMTSHLYSCLIHTHVTVLHVLLRRPSGSSRVELWETGGGERSSGGWSQVEVVIGRRHKGRR